MFAVLDNLRDTKDIKRAWENMKETIEISVKYSLGLYNLKKHKP
jgi:hypothetical protein